MLPPDGAKSNRAELISRPTLRYSHIPSANAQSARRPLPLCPRLGAERVGERGGHTYTSASANHYCTDTVCTEGEQRLWPCPAVNLPAVA